MIQVEDPYTWSYYLPWGCSVPRPPILASMPFSFFRSSFRWWTRYIPSFDSSPLPPATRATVERSFRWAQQKSRLARSALVSEFCGPSRAQSVQDGARSVERYRIALAHHGSPEETQSCRVVQNTRGPNVVPSRKTGNLEAIPFLFLSPLEPIYHLSWREIPLDHHHSSEVRSPKYLPVGAGGPAQRPSNVGFKAGFCCRHCCCPAGPHCCCIIQLTASSRPSRAPVPLHLVPSEPSGS